MPKAEDVHDRSASTYATRHRSFGWWTLLVFLTLGLTLETLHGFKIGWYLNVANETRRLMWTLAHAHGALLALVHLAFSATACRTDIDGGRWRRLASACLIGTTFLLPGGFFLGGALIYDGDPGLGVFLVPVGAVLFFVAVFLTARGVSAATDPKAPLRGDEPGAPLRGDVDP